MELKGLYHDFWLFREGERRYQDYYDLLSRRDAPIRIHDDLMQYFGDTIVWIPILNPSSSKAPARRSLNWNGPSIITKDGAPTFSAIWQAWADLFAAGPEQLVLTGHYHFSKDTPKGSYQKMDIERDALLILLRKLVEFGASAASGQYFIFHFGI